MTDAEKPKLIIDMTKLADLFCGLGQVSLHYALNLSPDIHEKFHLNFLVKPNQRNEWGYPVNLIKTNVLKRHFLKANSRFDIWHALHQDSVFVPAKGKGKYILTIHDLNFLSEKSPAKAKKRLARLQKKVNRADALCFISEFAKTNAAEHLNLQNKPVSVIYNGVPKLSDDMTKPQTAPKRKFLFNLGVLMPKKNHEAIINMMKYLPDYDLLIGGGGSSDYKNYLAQLTQKLGLENQIYFAGYLNEAEKSWAYHHAEAFVFPSLNEGFGLPIVEAMSAGLPVFCSDKTSLPEIGGYFASYWEHFDAQYMAEVLVNGMKSIAEAPDASQLKEYASQFSWEKNAAAYQTLYAKVLMT
ncbi:MAG: glycosyltransferase family 1 protein [Bacteroidota bacterium]|nr:glycosyltransferase family 1 protein [Bacteroidota bacterium]